MIMKLMRSLFSSVRLLSIIEEGLTEWEKTLQKIFSHCWDPARLWLQNGFRSTAKTPLKASVVHNLVSLSGTVDHTADWHVNMMTSSNGNTFRVTGPLCGEFTGHRWIPHIKASDAELWCFLRSASDLRLFVTIVCYDCLLRLFVTIVCYDCLLWLFVTICVWSTIVYSTVYSWINNHKAGDVRRYRAHYDVIVMNEKNDQSQTAIKMTSAFSMYLQDHQNSDWAKAWINIYSHIRLSDIVTGLGKLFLIHGLIWDIKYTSKTWLVRQIDKQVHKDKTDCRFRTQLHSLQFDVFFLMCLNNQVTKIDKPSKLDELCIHLASLQCRKYSDLIHHLVSSLYNHVFHPSIMF